MYRQMMKSKNREQECDSLLSSCVLDASRNTLADQFHPLISMEVLNEGRTSSSCFVSVQNNVKTCHELRSSHKGRHSRLSSLLSISRSSVGVWNPKRSILYKPETDKRQKIVVVSQPERSSVAAETQISPVELGISLSTSSDTCLTEDDLDYNIYNSKATGSSCTPTTLNQRRYTEEASFGVRSDYVNSVAHEKIPLQPEQDNKQAFVSENHRGLVLRSIILATGALICHHLKTFISRLCAPFMETLWFIFIDVIVETVSMAVYLISITLPIVLQICEKTMLWFVRQVCIRHLFITLYETFQNGRKNNDDDTAMTIHNFDDKVARRPLRLRHVSKDIIRKIRVHSNKAQLHS
jgi:hypothetical protein